MTKKRRSNQAVSEGVDIILLLGITIGLFGFLNYVVFSFSFEPSAPSVNLVGSIENGKIIIEHNGGDSLDGGTEIIITIESTESTTYENSISEISKNIGEWKLIVTNPDKNPDKWNFGESVQLTVDITGDDNIRAIVIDPSTNTLILSAVLQQKI